MNPDYLIVGAGSAGCVLAERLSADGRSNVLLLEAGPADSSPLIHMPKGFGKLLTDPHHVWYLPTEAAAGIPAEVWVRGKVLGGSSSVNGMMYFRGHPDDYDQWERLGARGWGWTDMARAFNAIENHELGDGDGRGVNGPVKISVSPGRSDLGDRLIAAANAIGVKQVRDLNHPDQEGIAYATRTIFKGRRQSAAQAFLTPAKNRTNLQIKTGVIIDRVIFDGRRAVGVHVSQNGRQFELRTAGEVILSAGALSSPTILQRSGVGSAVDLKRLGIDVVCDSPQIGRNLLEHRLLMMHYGLNRPLSINPSLRGWRLVGSALRYMLGRKGVLAAASYEVGAFIKTRPHLDRPDAEILAAPYGYALDENERVEVPRGHSFHMFGYPLRVRSQGSIMIRSSDPTSPAAIHPNYLSDPYDQDVTIAMFRFMRKLVSQKAVADVVSEEIAPGATVESDTEILDAFRSRGLAGYHACGTVATGGAAAPLDERLRLRGVHNLRVVDGSIMPTMVSANTNGPIMAIGWRAAELILQDRT